MHVGKKKGAKRKGPPQKGKSSAPASSPAQQANSKAAQKQTPADGASNRALSVRSLAQKLEELNPDLEGAGQLLDGVSLHLSKASPVKAVPRSLTQCNQFCVGIGKHYCVWCLLQLCACAAGQQLFYSQGCKLSRRRQFQQVHH